MAQWDSGWASHTPRAQSAASPGVGLARITLTRHEGLGVPRWHQVTFLYRETGCRGSLGAGRGLRLPGHSSGLRVSGQAQGQGLPCGPGISGCGPCMSRVSSHTRSGRGRWVQSAARGSCVATGGAAPREARRRQRHSPAAPGGVTLGCYRCLRAMGGAGASGVSPACSWGVAQPLAAGLGCSPPTEEQGARGQGTAQPPPATHTLPPAHGANFTPQCGYL